MHIRPFMVVLMVVWSVALVTSGQRTDIFITSRNHPAIAYDTGPVRDPVQELDAKLASGRLRLTFEPGRGYLRSVLEALKLPVDSQALIFSQTSAQFDRISPSNPRAVYFNDTAAVGWVPGSDELELAGHDPRQGYVFYSLSQSASAPPRLRRRTDCLLCHQAAETLGVPGPLVLSTFQMSNDPNAYASGTAVDHRTPADQRWGGYYVTGRLGAAWHRGNVPVVVSEAELKRPRSAPPHLTSIAGKFDTTRYPGTCSDAVALSVLAHQAQMANFITRAGWEARVNPSGPRVTEAVTELVDYMLFVDEAAMIGRIEASCGFAKAFAAAGPFDQQGRSLRDLAADGRLMRYPCSYMIYSPAFDDLPAAVKDAVYRRLWGVLSGRERSAPYDSRLSLADRRAIVEILRDTKKGLPGFFWDRLN